MVELLERDAVLADLAADLEGTRSGGGRAVLISGEAGIGKTALVERFTSAYGEAARVLWGGCEALFTPRPLGPLYDIARQTQGKLATLLDAEAERPAIFTALLDELHEGAPPTIVVIEDVHWADEATLDLLKFLGRRLHQVAVLLVVTYREDEVGPDHPLRFVLGDLPSRITHRRRLPGLSAEAVATLAHQAGRTAADLHAVTGGNPFFVTEVLASREQRVPATVRDAVLARVSRLSPAAHEVLEVVSVVPGRAEHWLLDAVLPPALDTLGECVHAGVLRLDGDALAFRHELARLAVNESLFPPHRRTLHARVLAALAARRPVALARLVHHADQAGDGPAVLRFAPTAARQAASLSAHREAASHYRTALRFAEALPPEERSRLLEGLSYECYLTDQIGDALEARTEALALWRGLGRRREQGDTLRWLSRLHWFAGQKAEADRYAVEAVETLEPLSPGPELAMAYSNRAHLHMLADETTEAVRWGEKAIGLAERLGAVETLAHALNNVGAAQLLADDETGWDNLQRSLALAREHDLQEHAARAFTNLGTCAARVHDYGQALGYLDPGIAYATQRDLDAWRLYMTAWRARCHFERGDWTRAADDAGWVLAQPKVSVITRIPALAVLGHVRVRRGDPDAAPLLAEARDLAMQAAELQRIAPVAAARAEAAWWAGRPEEIRAEAGPVLDLARRNRDAWVLGEIGFWVERAGGSAGPPEGAAEPYALQRRGDWRGAAAAWRRLGCPYEEALALAEGDETAQKAALEIVEALGAGPATEALRQRMRAGGVRGIPRGPRPSTRANPEGLTARQLEVLRLLAEGLTNAEIAQRLFIATKTAGHHVSAVLAKLGARSRMEAAGLARDQGLLTQDRA